MGKAKMYGIKTTYIPNCKTDQKRHKPLHKKGKVKK